MRILAQWYLRLYNICLVTIAQAAVANHARFAFTAQTAAVAAQLLHTVLETNCTLRFYTAPAYFGSNATSGKSMRSADFTNLPLIMRPVRSLISL